MIINGIWISLMILVYSRGTFIVEPQTLMSYALCFCDTCNILCASLSVLLGDEGIANKACYLCTPKAR
jgi:hypothetical protein